MTLREESNLTSTGPGTSPPFARRCYGRLCPTSGRTMKVRSSVNKNNWGDAREASYRAEAENIAFSMKRRMVVRGDSVYLRHGELEELLVTERQSKALWFDVWTGCV